MKWWAHNVAEVHTCIHAEVLHALWDSGAKHVEVNLLNIHIFHNREGKIAQCPLNGTGN